MDKVDSLLANCVSACFRCVYDNLKMLGGFDQIMGLIGQLIITAKKLYAIRDEL